MDGTKFLILDSLKNKCTLAAVVSLIQLNKMHCWMHDKNTKIHQPHGNDVLYRTVSYMIGVLLAPHNANAKTNLY